MISDSAALSRFREYRECAVMSVRVLFALAALAALPAAPAAPALPPTLAETHGPRGIAYAPRYPLWSDGMEKRRWIELPAGSAIDKSNPDAWRFPVGTRAWKEFRRDGRPVETRFIERLADGSWRFLAYRWNAEGTQATLAPEEGVPESGIPSRTDCLACHEGAAVPILGYSAVQLETELAPALGYLHGNCGHCHNDGALPALELTLAQSAADPRAGAERMRASLLGRASRFRPREATSAPRRVVPGDPDASLLVARMQSRDALTRMPPLGVSVPDPNGIAMVRRWIEQLKFHPKE
jgi:hypothetical protein